MLLLLAVVKCCFKKIIIVKLELIVCVAMHISTYLYNYYTTTSPTMATYRITLVFLGGIHDMHC